MTNQSDQILDEINDDEKLIEAQTSRIENFEENLRRIEKSRHHIADNDTDFNTQHTDETNNFLSQQLRNAEVTMLRLYNLQRARLLKQQAQNITTRVQTFKSNFTESESLKMLSSKIVDSQSTNAQLMKFKKSIVAVAVDALSSSISLSFKSKIIKSEKMRTYKNQSENEY